MQKRYYFFQIEKIRKYEISEGNLETRKKVQKKFLIILIFQIFDCAGLLVGGLISGSLSILGEAIDNAGDFFS